MKPSNPTLWLYVCLFGFLIVLGLAYVFQPMAFERLPWPWFLIFFCPLLMFIMGHGNHSNHETHDKKQADDTDDAEQ